MSSEEEKQDAVVSESTIDEKPFSEDASPRTSDVEQLRLLSAELEDMTKRVQALTPDLEPPPFSPKRLVALIERLLSKFPKDVQLGILEQLQSALRQDAFDPDLWKGMWYMLNYTLRYNVDLVRRRYAGEFETDAWGLDWEFVDAMLPFLTFLYRVYWRVEVTRLENIPSEGRALLVANHSGQLPWDGMMIGTAILTEHPSRRLMRTLYAAILPGIPYVSTMLARLGQALATVENGTRLLEQEELVAVFPEGYKGTGKLYRDRYRLARFGRGGFAQMALNTGAPIIPVSVVGSEETYFTLAKLPTFSGITGIPYLPITLRFPWLGLLGIVPLPTKWYIDFGEPILVNNYGADSADSMVQVSQLTDQVRNTVQNMVHHRLAHRRSVFFG
ncbi:MAG: glycerol acyltransferase [Anaerolineae bacterium]|nr:glycerol acyltransferase [Anaerolineae bacterium]